MVWSYGVEPHFGVALFPFLFFLYMHTVHSFTVDDKKITQNPCALLSCYGY